MERAREMAAWDDVELLDMKFDEAGDAYTYPCPCGDDFIMCVDDLINAEELAPCPSCSLLLRVVYDPEEFLESMGLLVTDDESEAQEQDKGEDGKCIKNGQEDAEKDQVTKENLDG